MRELELQKGRALVVIAHPDDETIWIGGTILRYRNINWTIFVLSRKNDPDRYPKFLRVVKLYCARAIISDLDDEGKLTFKESLPEIETRILRKMRGEKFDYIFTHAPDGEYGHERHKGVHAVVKRLVQKGELLSNNLLFFAYEQDRGRGICVASPRAEFYLKLSKEEFKTKRDIVKNIYGFSKFSFENRSCTKVETFDKYYL